MESLMKWAELGWVITLYFKEFNFRLHIQTWLSFYVTVFNVVWKYENTEIRGLFTYYLRGIRKISTNICGLYNSRGQKMRASSTIKTTITSITTYKTALQSIHTWIYYDIITSVTQTILGANETTPTRR